MIEVKPFEQEHLQAIELQAAQAGVDIGGALAVIDSCNSYSVFGDGGLICVAGFMKLEGITFVWALLSDKAGKHMLSLTRAIRGRISSVTTPLFTAVDCGHKEGYRWADMFGFKRTNLIAGNGRGGTTEFMARA